MGTKMNENGISLCKTGEEKYERYSFRGQKYIQYDWRCHTGELFSCVGKNLADCRMKRDIHFFGVER